MRRRARGPNGEELLARFWAVPPSALIRFGCGCCAQPNRPERLHPSSLETERVFQLKGHLAPVHGSTARTAPKQPVAHWQAMDKPRRVFTNPARGWQKLVKFYQSKSISALTKCRSDAKPAEDLPANKNSERKVELASTSTEPKCSLSFSGL